MSEAVAEPRVWPVGPRALAGLSAVAVVAWLILPTAPNYDTASHLVWSHELLAGRAPDVEYAASPTMHPLWLIAAIVAALTGGGASLLQLVTLLSLMVVVACAYRLAADVAGQVAGIVGAVAAGSSFALLLLTFKAYVDMPFLAVVLTAVVVERAWRPAGAELAGGSAGLAGAELAGASEGPGGDAPAGASTGPGGAELAGASTGPEDGERRNSPPIAVVIRRSPGEQAPGSRRTSDLTMPLLMLAAGLLRPEAWAIGLLFLGLRLVRGGAIGSVVVPALIVLAAPIIWALFDLALTGDPMHSLTGTQALAEELGRKTGLGNAPKELAVQLSDLARPPIAAAGVLGVALAIQLAGLRRLLVPLVTLGASLVGFLLVGALGLPLLQRYLQLPAVLLCVFAGIAAAVILATARGQRLASGDAAEYPRREGADDLDFVRQDGDPEATPAPLASEPFHGKEGVASSSLVRPTPETRSGSPAPIAAPESAAPTPALRAVAAVALIVGVLGAGGYLVLKADSFRIVGEGVLREADWQRDGARLLDDPRVQQAAKCGPITLPTYRFIPEVTLRAGLDAGTVVSRATALGGAGAQTRGVAIVIDGSRQAKTRLGWAAGVPRDTNEVPPGFEVIARRGPFVAASSCG